VLPPIEVAEELSLKNVLPPIEVAEEPSLKNVLLPIEVALTPFEQKKLFPIDVHESATATDGVAKKHMQLRILNDIFIVKNLRICSQIKTSG